jgi:flagellar assembly protein FliH
MAKNVYRAGEIKFSETLIHISPPVLPKFKASGGFEEMTELPPPPVYTGPSPEEVERELAEFRNRMDAERQQLSSQAQEEAQRIVKEAEKVAFDEIQRKGAIAQETKNRADAEAQATIAAAQAKADELVSEAQKRVAEIEKDAYQRGLEQGKVDGWQDGRAEAERLIERLHIIIARAIERRNEIMTESESQLVGLVLNIARKVVKVLTENQRNVVVNNVLQALRKLKSKTDVSIRVNIADLKVTTEHIKDITERIERVGNITVMEDATVDPGGCIIETDFGEIDARISSQFQEIEDKILEVTPIKTRAREVAEG